ncbi:MAG: hypothetical protein R3A51_19570 [Nannocystaceae bacterium]
MCFETASQYEAIDGQAWQRLETLYADLGDDHALVSLYEARVEHMPESMTTEQLLTAARVYRDNLKDDERASFFFYKVLEREPFNPIAFEGYKEHWRRKNNWLHLRDLILYQIDQAMSYQGDGSPLRDPAFAQEFIEVAEICVKRLGDIHGAIDVWNRMAQCYPRDPRPRTELAAIDKRSRAWERAEQAQFDELARTSDPEGRMIPLRRLSALYSERLVDAERAMEVYDELVATAPDDRAVMDGLIEVYERTGSWDAVIQLLRQQYEVSRSPGERVDLLRRMAELWHHELESHEDAIWACNEILTFHEGDLEALHRLQTLYNEHSHHEAHYDCLERELRLSEDPADKIRLLRQMANVAEHHLQDSARSSAAWYELHDLDPHNLEVVDKLIVAYEQAAQWAELADLLGKTASSKRTPKIRQLDYSLRLGYLAQDTLHDPDRACSAFERAVRIHRYHRGAVESLTRLYREIKSWHSLAATLGTLREIVDSDEEALQIGWEQAEVLAEQLDNAPAAIRVLEQLAAEVAVGNRDVSLRLLELYERAQQPRKLIRQAEILLLSSNALDERRDLFASIARAWIEVGDAKAAASAFSRFRAEFPDDPEGVRIEAELREAGGDHAGTLALLEQQLAAFEHIDEKLSTLEHMAKVCERMGEPRRGLALLGRALSITPDPESSLTTIETYAARHGLWKDMLALLSNRYTELSSGADPDGQMAACMRSARIAAEELGDPQMAFSWGKKAYFVALEHRLDAGPALDFLEALAEKHALWEELLGVTEQELKVRSQSSAIEDYATINLLLTSSEIALTRLADPARAINYLHRAHELRPDDKDLARQIEDLAKKHGKFQELIRLGERRMRQAGSALARFEVCIDIARIYEKDLEDPAGSFHYLRRTWKEFRETESSLAEEALDMAVALGERYELWSELASHHVELARGHFKRPGGRRDGFDALLEGAKVEEEQREDLLGAIRILREGLEFDPDGEELLPIIESLAERHDEARDDGAPATGALAVLGVLQRLIAAADRRGKIRLLTRRAELREGRLADPVGAMAEWLRVLELDPEHPAAQAALERLAEQQQRWDLALLLPAAEHERLRDEDPDEHVEELRACLAEIAQIYEERLACPEFALRARLAAWRLRPELPTPEDADELEPPVDPEHATLWRLAAAIGDFHSPPPPPDLLQPRVSPPEIADEALWRRAGLDSTTLRPRVERAEEEPEDEGLIELSSIDALPEGAPRREPTNVVDIEELEEIEASVELSGVGKAPREPTNVVNIDELEEITDEEVLEDIPELDAELGAEALDDLEGSATSTTSTTSTRSRTSSCSR